MNKLLLAALAALLAAPIARAQTAPPPSKWGSVELGGGGYKPNIDHEFHGSATPWRDAFGGGPAPMYRLHVAKSIWDGFGSLELGFKTGFFSKSGHALTTTPPYTRTGDRTTFNIIPTSITVTWRGDLVYEQAHVPLVPYVRAAFERYNWWVTKQGNWGRRGATNGWSASAGLVLVLDWLDPDAAREMGRDYSVSHTGLYFDVTKSKVDDFGSKKSWDLSEKGLFWSTGLLVVF
ncbi:MAG TPA: MXAN_2562 family outer membrane beta-barrel protein [Anaeromyxobacter sp.]|nr:MXAN_2562 family outer membrane beta-barrel protein [Anaeromyxobacter sp.]